MSEIKLSTPIQAVAFDCFGTLISFGERLDPYRHFSAPRSDTQVRRQLMTRDASLATYAQEFGLAHKLPEMQTELDRELASLQLFPDVLTAFDRLRRTRLSIAVCSNLASDYGPTVRRLLPDVDACVLSFEVGAVKPERAIFDRLCSALRCQATDVLFIGDSQRCDVQGPIAFGMQARLLDRRGGQTLLDLLEGVA